jgi:AcrR family transcriptional regulator
MAGDSRDAEPSTSARRYGRLRPGPGLSREIVETHQRSRLRRATIELVATHGYETLTVRRLTKRARISSGTFYSLYRSTDECLVATFDLVCQRASQRVVEAGQNQSEPRRRLGLAIDHLFQDMAAAPQVATFMLRSAPAMGPAFAGELRSSAMRLGFALDTCMSSGSSPPLHPLLLEGIVAGLIRIGRVLVPATGEDGVRAVSAEAVDWIMSLNVPLADAGLPSAAVPPSSGNGPPLPGRLSNGDWEGALGDDRAMILAAAFRIARGGYHHLSVQRICREAGVSRRGFKSQFAGLEDCFISALEERAAGAIEASVNRQTSATSWRCAVGEALTALCSSIEADRDGARVLFIEIAAAGAEGIESRDRLISQVAHALRTTAPEEQGPSELAAEASAAAAWAVLSHRVQDQSAPTSAVLPVLGLLMLAPTLGGPAALGAIQIGGDKKHTVGDRKQ